MDAEKFTAEWEAAEPLLRNTARKLAGRRYPNEIEDFMQEAAMTAWRKLSGFRGDAQFSTWAVRILVNVFLMRVRSGRYRDHMLSIDEPIGEEQNLTPELIDSKPLPDRFPLRQLDEIIDNLSDSLTPALAETLRLFAGDLDYAEISIRLGISMPATKSRIMRMRRELRGNS